MPFLNLSEKAGQGNGVLRNKRRLRTDLLKEGLGELLDGQHVDKEGAPAEPLERDGAQHTLSGQDARADDDDVGVLLAEVINVPGEEGEKGEFQKQGTRLASGEAEGKEISGD